MSTLSVQLFISMSTGVHDQYNLIDLWVHEFTIITTVYIYMLKWVHDQYYCLDLWVHEYTTWQYNISRNRGESWKCYTGNKLTYYKMSNNINLKGLLA